MTLKHFYFGLSKEDYNVIGGVVSDFNFQTDYITRYIEKRLVKEKFETSNFNTIMIRGRKGYSRKIILKELFESLEIEIPFNENQYKFLYPYKNEYPLIGLLHPVLKEDEFNEFLFKRVMEALQNGKEQKAPIPFDFLINTCLDFKLNGFKNEWVHKAKTFKEYDIKATLFCKLTCNYFSLELIIEKSKREVFRKEILKTLPNGSMYKGEFKDLLIENSKLIVSREDFENPILYEVLLSEILTDKK